MKRIALTLGAALVALGAATAFVLVDDEAAGRREGPTIVTSTTYTIWLVDPPQPLDGSDLPNTPG
jgi:hypothetical protein